MDYKITVDIKQTDRFILKILYNNAELFHISLFTKDNYDGVPQIRGLHFTSPNQIHHLYISHVELENSLKEGPKTDVEFFSKILRTMGIM